MRTRIRANDSNKCLITPSPDVIVLGPDATAETLGASFTVLDQSRESYGDHFDDDLVIGLREVHVTSIDAKYRQRLELLMQRVSTAEIRTIEGVGSARAIDV